MMVGDFAVYVQADQIIPKSPAYMMMDMRPEFQENGKA